MALAEGTTIKPEDLPERIRTSGQTISLLSQARQRRLTLRELEREYIFETLRLTNGNKSKAAEMLGFDRRTLHRKLDEYREEDPSIDL